jgi:hypothetical protein
MTEFATFTAPVAGRYHFVHGHEPHLESECTEACRAPFGVVLPLGERRKIEFATEPFAGPSWYWDEEPNA